jgi:hypothetical protein
MGILPAIGFLIGIAIGISGIGAPMLFPALVFLGLPPQLVVGTDLAFLAFTRAFASSLHAKEKNIDWKSFVFLIIPVIPAMILGKLVWDAIKINFGSEVLDGVILLLLGLVFLGVSFHLVKFHLLGNYFEPFTVPRGEKKSNQIEPKPIHTRKNKLIWIFTAGPISFVYQISGLGAASIMLPVLVKTLRSPKLAAGTMGIYGLVAASFGTVLHYSMDNIPFLVVAFLLIGSIPGVLLGVRWVSIISPRKLITIFAGLIFMGGVFLLIKWIGLL